MIMKLLIACTMLSCSAAAQMAPAGSPSSAPGATTYGAPSTNVAAQNGQPYAPSSTPGYATYGAPVVPNQAGLPAPYPTTYPPPLPQQQ